MMLGLMMVGGGVDKDKFSVEGHSLYAVCVGVQNELYYVKRPDSGLLAEGQKGTNPETGNTGI